MNKEYFSNCYWLSIFLFHLQRIGNQIRAPAIAPLQLDGRWCQECTLQPGRWWRQGLGGTLHQRTVGTNSDTIDSLNTNSGDVQTYFSATAADRMFPTHTHTLHLWWHFRKQDERRRRQMQTRWNRRRRRRCMRSKREEKKGRNRK